MLLIVEERDTIKNIWNLILIYKGFIFLAANFAGQIHYCLLLSQMLTSFARIFVDDQPVARLYGIE
jgi:uncharacterized membrane protein YpjA